MAVCSWPDAGSAGRACSRSPRRPARWSRRLPRHLTADSGDTLSVERLALVGTRLFVRGRTVRALNGEARYLLAAVSTSTGAFDAWAPTVFAPTSVAVDLVPLDTRLYIGRVIGAPLQRRTHLAAVNVVTGAVLAFDPNGGGTSQLVPPVTSLAANDEFLFAGTSLGQIRRVDLASGLADGWTVLTSAAGGAQGYIASILATPTRVYAGGYFNQVVTSTQAQPAARGHGLAVDIASVQLTAWDPRISQRRDLAGHLAASGGSDGAGGRDRRDRRQLLIGGWGSPRRPRRAERRGWRCDFTCDDAGRWHDDRRVGALRHARVLRRRGRRRGAHDRRRPISSRVP